MSKEIILDIDNLTVGYTKDSPIIKNCNLRISKGEFVSIIGRSGIGKTTLLNSIADNSFKISGSIKKPDRLGYVFQNRSLFPSMTVKKNIYFGLNKEERKFKEKILSEVLQKVELVGYEDNYPFQLSGGQQLRIAIARSLCYNGSLILLDEPFNGLDHITSKNVVNWFLSLIGDEKAFLSVSHDIENAIILSDRIYILSDGILSEPIVIDVPRDQRINLRNSEKILEYRNKIDLLYK